MTAAFTPGPLRLPAARKPGPHPIHRLFNFERARGLISLASWCCSGCSATVPGSVVLLVTKAARGALDLLDQPVGALGPGIGDLRLEEDQQLGLPALDRLGKGGDLGDVDAGAPVIKAEQAGGDLGAAGSPIARPPSPPPRRRGRSAVERRRRRCHRWRRSRPSCSHAWLAFLLNRRRVTSRTPTVAPRGRRNRSRRCRRYTPRAVIRAQPRSRGVTGAALGRWCGVPGRADRVTRGRW